MTSKKYYSSNEYFAKLPDKNSKRRIIKKIHNYSVFLSASVVPIIIKKISSKEDNIVTTINAASYISAVIAARKNKKLPIREASIIL